MTKIDQSGLRYKYNAFLTRNSLFLLETRFSYSKLAFLTRNSLFLLETRFSNSKLTFLTRNSLFLLETRFSYSKLTFLTRNSLFLLETHFFFTRNSLFLLETRYSKNRTPQPSRRYFSYVQLCHKGWQDFKDNICEYCENFSFLEALCIFHDWECVGRYPYLHNLFMSVCLSNIVRSHIQRHRKYS